MYLSQIVKCICLKLQNVFVEWESRQHRAPPRPPPIPLWALCSTHHPTLERLRSPAIDLSLDLSDGHQLPPRGREGDPRKKSTIPFSLLNVCDVLRRELGQKMERPFYISSLESSFHQLVQSGQMMICNNHEISFIRLKYTARSGHYLLWNWWNVAETDVNCQHQHHRSLSLGSFLPIGNVNILVRY